MGSPNNKKATLKAASPSLDKYKNNGDIFSNIEYICGSTALIVDSLQKGLDVAQLPSGDVIITEIKTVNTQYSWDHEKQRMVRISQTN